MYIVQYIYSIYTLHTVYTMHTIQCTMEIDRVEYTLNRIYMSLIYPEYIEGFDSVIGQCIDIVYDIYIHCTLYWIYITLIILMAFIIIYLSNRHIHIKNICVFSNKLL